MKFIILGNSHLQAQVDDEDYTRVRQYNWSLNPKYVCSGINGKTIYLHHLVLEIVGNVDFPVLHLDDNPLNCQKYNLTQGLVSDNTQGVPHPKNVTVRSKYIGVSWNKRDKIWEGCIMRFGKHYHLGYSQDEEYLAKKYNEKALELYGSYAKLNKIRSKA